MKTLIRGGYVVAFDGQNHHVIRDGEVVFENDKILFAGQAYPGEVDRTLAAPGKLVCPGFINILGWAALDVPLRMDAFYGARCLSEQYIVQGLGREDLGPPLGEDFRTMCLAGMASLLEGGSTTTATVTAMDPMPWESPMEQTEILAQTVGEIGARAYISHNYRSAGKYCPQRGVTRYHWSEAAGQAGLRNALKFAEQHDGDYGGRVRAMLFPYTLDTSSPELLRATKQAAHDTGLLIHMFTAQSLYEYHEMKRRHGQTPIQFLYEMGFMDPDVHLIHAHFTTAHAATGGARGDVSDVDLLAKSGVTVGHTPVVLARYGEALVSLGQYLRAGVRVGLGTDEFPMDIIREMRCAALFSKVLDRDHLSVTARDVFNAVTLAGAQALGRDDLGRLAAGAKADILIIDLDDLHVGLTVDDPIKTLVYMASQRDVQTVIVDGKTVVEGGKVVGLDKADLAEKMRRVLGRQTRALIRHNASGLTLEEMFPPSFPPAG
jgi:cytosine/adenosine deaminase-related metal-dependent hydrolase